MQRAAGDPVAELEEQQTHARRVSETVGTFGRGLYAGSFYLTTPRGEALFGLAVKGDTTQALDFKELRTFLQEHGYEEAYDVLDRVRYHTVAQQSTPFDPFEWWSNERVYLDPPTGDTSEALIFRAIEAAEEARYSEGY